MRPFNLTEFATVEEMLEAKAIRQHRANLEYGGVFNADGTRFSDIAIERIAARNKLRWSTMCAAWIIEGFGESKNALVSH